MKRSFFARCLAWTAPIWLLAPSVGLADPPPPQPAADLFAPLRALPFHPQGQLRVELGLLFADLRAYIRRSEQTAANQKQTQLGQAFHAVGGHVDWVKHLRHLVDIGGLQGPVAAGIGVFASPSVQGVQAVLAIDPGFMARLQQQQQASPPPAWADHIKVKDGALLISLDPEDPSMVLHGRAAGDGWLRLAPAEPMLRLPKGEDPGFDPGFSRWAQKGDTLLFARGGGMLSSLVATKITDATLREILRDTRTVGIGYGDDGERTVGARLLLDIPTLAANAKVFRRPDLHNHFLHLWDADMVSAASVSLPPAMLGRLAKEFRDELGDDDAVPQALKDAATTMDGRLGVAAFGAPGDWAVGLQFEGADVAQALLPVANELRQKISQKLAKNPSMFAAALDLRALAGVPGEVLHVRPDVGLEGIRIGALGASLVGTTQKTRLQRLSQENRKQIAVAQTLTPAMAEALSQPAMLVAYSVVGDATDLIAPFTWLAGSAKGGLALALEDSPRAARWLSGVVDGLPTMMALQTVNAALLYDVAMTVDLVDGIVVAQLLASEL